MILDIEVPVMLEEYLRTHGYINQYETIECRSLAGGVSNRTVLVRREEGELWVVKQALGKLRVAVDWFSSPARIHHEALALREVTHLLPDGTIPKLIFEDWDEHILAMSAVPEPHTNWKHMLLDGDLCSEHVYQFATLLSCLHQSSAAQRETLAGKFGDRTFFETLRLEPYYAYTATQIPLADSFFCSLIEETRRRRFCLVHGDFSPKNILVYHEKLVLLDYEVIHWGDPAFDIGFALTHLLSKAHHLSQHRKQFAQAATTFWQHYWAGVEGQAWSEDLQLWALRHTIACLLARVRGRSPLEYLSTTEQQRQQEIGLALLNREPHDILDLIEQFTAAC